MIPNSIFMNTQRKILIGYTSRLFCDGMEAILQENKGYKIVDSVPARNGIAERLSIKNGEEVDILLIELCKPRKHDIDFVKSLLEGFNGLKVFLVSHLPHHKISKELIEMGIGAFLLKSCSKKDLIMALDKLSAGLNYYCTDITMSIMHPRKEVSYEDEVHLTEREKQVLSELVNSKTNYQIADKLKLSENTVKAHRRNIQNKFGVNNLMGMVRYACRSNLIDFGRDEFCIECPHCLPN